MKTVEVTTTQNVVIEYQLASLRDRIVAWIVDVIFIGIAVMIATLIIRNAVNSYQLRDSILLIVNMGILFLYTLLFEIFMNGQTPGKRIIGIKVINLIGVPPSLSEYLIRWSMRMADIYFSFGLLAIILINSNSMSQRLGDLLANTILIKINHRNSMSINKLTGLYNLTESYLPSYTGIVNFSESDMLFIKQVTDRYKKYPNSSHRELVEKIANKTAILLELEKVPDNKVKFLKTLLKDYIILTR